jgi:hypothetical protein
MIAVPQAELNKVYKQMKFLVNKAPHGTCVLSLNCLSP